MIVVKPIPFDEGLAFLLHYISGSIINVGVPTQFEDIKNARNHPV